jgi:hypothetical protein
MTLELGDHVWYWNHRLSFDLNVPRATWFPGSNPNDPTDFLGQGGEIHNYVVHADEVVRGRPHLKNAAGNFAWLDNNPGNITGHLGGPNLGQYPGKFNCHAYLVFPTRQAGYDAIGKLLRTAPYANASIMDAFLKHTPVSDDNDPIAYANAVAARLGVPVSTRVGQLDDLQLLVMQDQIEDIEPAIAGERLAWDSAEIPAEIAQLLPGSSRSAAAGPEFRGVPLALLDLSGWQDDADESPGTA